MFIEFVHATVKKGFILEIEGEEKLDLCLSEEEEGEYLKETIKVELVIAVIKLF